MSSLWRGSLLPLLAELNISVELPAGPFQEDRDAPSPQNSPTSLETNRTQILHGTELTRFTEIKEEVLL